MTARCLMVQGTASSVGKSVLVAALCRIFRQDGYRVAPFKAQNMALNSYATLEGEEIGRAQAMQAEAAGILPHVTMNPILLKPEAEARSQVVVLGRPVEVVDAAHYYQHRDRHWAIVVEALAALRAGYDMVVIEGAGSPAEVNIKDGDIVNMRVACHAQSPVLLVGDIDRGGVFASLLGTLDLLAPEERSLVRGIVVNKFRGDLRLFDSGLRFLEERSAKPVLGVVPYYRDIALAEEDSVALENRLVARFCPRCGERLDAAASVEVAIIQLPHIANFDDFDPLAQESGVAVRYVQSVAELARPDLIILPGTKTTLEDLAWLRGRGLASRIVSLAGEGVPVFGICGGFQMLGKTINDAFGVEGARREAAGLGLLNVTTTFAREKSVCQVRVVPAVEVGPLAGLAADILDGYEIHMGQTLAAEGEVSPMFQVVARSGEPVKALDGAIDPGGLIWGSYVHGLFGNDTFRRGVLRQLAARKGRPLDFGPALPSRQEQYDRLAAHFREHLDLDRLYQIIGLSGAKG